ncbi:hypothetical protein [Streptomyces angustmyceticus]
MAAFAAQSDAKGTLVTGSPPRFLSGPRGQLQPLAELGPEWTV